MMALDAWNCGEDQRSALNRPASALFSNFEVLSKQVSVLHYSDDLGLPLSLSKFYSLEEKSPAPEAEPSASSEAAIFSGTRLRVARHPRQR
jgi:hypothetical protein